MQFFTTCFMTRTKLRTIFTVLPSSLLILSSCYQQEENLFLSTDELSLTCVQSNWTDTRATMDSEGQGSFSEGDRIDIQVTGEKKQLPPNWNTPMASGHPSYNATNMEPET